MPAKTRKFKTEVNEVLDLVVHSLYARKEIFLRELISNASDAIDRARFESLTNKQLATPESGWRIELRANANGRTLTISDNGIGMTAEELDKNLGTIAGSGTRGFVEALHAQRDAAAPDLIGRFGVGFYSAFMVAESVTVRSKRAGSEAPAASWSSSGDGRYKLEEGIEKESSGTEVILQLREDAQEYLEPDRVRRLVREHSDYIAFPIVLCPAPDSEGGREETLNSMKALWKRAPREVNPEEYNSFCQHLTHDDAAPLEVIHFAAEGALEFNALLFIPARIPARMFLPQGRGGLQLYVRNVFITADCKDLLPDYLGFISGVVDSRDLPLNVSRETLQDHAIPRRIRKNLVGKTLKTLGDLLERRRKDYEGFFGNFGPFLKEGLHADPSERDRLRDLLLFTSTATENGSLTTLKEYRDRMPSGQPAIYYLTASSLAEARNAPQLEGFRKQGYEVLLFTDLADEMMAGVLQSVEGKPFKAVDRGDAEADLESGKDVMAGDNQASARDLQPLLDRIQTELAGDIKEVRLSKRLTDSPCCLVLDASGMSRQMEAALRRMQQENLPAAPRILEINPSHPDILDLKGLLVDPASERLADRIQVLYDQALLLQGEPVRDARQFSARLSRLLTLPVEE